MREDVHILYVLFLRRLRACSFFVPVKGKEMVKMKITTKQLTMAGLMAALSVAIMFIEFNLPFVPPFLKLDFSDVPALIGGVTISPVIGVLVIVVKNLIHLLMTSTGGAGETANIIMGCCYIVPIAVMARKGTKMKVAGAIIGIVAMTAAASFCNYFILIPWYSNVMPMDTIIEMCAKVNSLITTKLDIITYGVIPFNLLKGVINTVLALIIVRYLPKTEKITGAV